jgi:LmbE family N-acetylglucosaminyl deacetylase
MKRILFVFSHPDDESFITGGTIAKYVSLGYNVQLICLTRGQFEWQEHHFDLQSSYAQARQAELEKAAAILGIHDLHVLDYADGKLKKIEPGELEEDIFKRMKNIEPDIVVTFESRGISNHPDHIKTSLSTTYAFQKYAEYFVHGEALGKRDPRRRFVDKLGGFENRAEPKLYHACIPQEVVSYLIKHEVIPVESFGKPWQGVDDKKVNTVIDIREFTEKKIHALAQHQTQISDVERFTSIDTNPLAYQEYYIFRMQGTEEIFLGKDESIAGEF